MGGLTFGAPLVLVLLAVLPALYFLLRLTPPPPRRLPLPTLPLVRDLVGREREPARTPWWLLLIRLLAAALLILAFAGPRWQPEGAGGDAGQGPLVLMIDDGWAAAGDWSLRQQRGLALLDRAADRPVALLAASRANEATLFEPARAAREKLTALQPRPYRVPREAMFERARALLAEAPDARAIWISDGLLAADERARLDLVRGDLGDRLTLVGRLDRPTSALMGVENPGTGLDVRARRAGAVLPAQPGLVRALDEKGRFLGEAGFAFAQGEAEATARLALPLELINAIARLELAGERHAGAVHLVDAGSSRRRVALVTGETIDTAQPLVSARYFVARALQPFADLREPARGVSDPIGAALEERPDILVLIDIGTIRGETADKVTAFVERGGVLVRFAGPALAASGDDLLPVRLRRGGRILGGALSWDKPQILAPFPENSPFAGLAIRDPILVERQVLAEPDPELSRTSWAVLGDGTPLVSGVTRGQGQIVLFHVTGDTAWSNLPLSGTFVDMLRRVLVRAASRGGEGSDGTEQRLAPRVALDAFGVSGAPGADARPMVPRRTPVATRDHPPGFYGPPEANVALNALSRETPFEAIVWPPGQTVPLTEAPSLEFRPWLMLAAFLLLLLDTLAVLALARGWRRPAGFRLAGFAALVAGLALATGESLAQPARPAPPLPNVSAEDIRSSLRPRLAYVRTGNATLDETSRAGLAGLGQVLAQRTSIQLDEPIGVDPARDELVFYSMLYWPIEAGQPRPAPAAIRAVDAFMKQGGTVVFDTRDAFVQRRGGTPTPETRALREMLASLDLPELEPVPPDHVLTKAFYLIDRMTGRYATGDTWVEAVAGARASKAPVRAGDRVSPIVITSADLASAWALDRLGRPMFPLVPGEPRQREFALRSGVNLVMYLMTGNYKADQVHVPALLERLGQ